MRYLVGCLLMLVMVGVGCTSSSTQTTSGRSYLDGYATPGPVVTGDGERAPLTVDQEVREVAAVEPLLRFPARIGLVRVQNGQLSNVPEAEYEAWRAAVDRLGPDYGEFVPVSPLIAEMVYQDRSEGRKRARSKDELVRKIRLGAARQHCEVVLIYEVFSTSRHERRDLASDVAKLTILGMYLIPSKETETVGYANALLLDVRNGYPYGTASASTTERDVHTIMAHWEAVRDMTERTQTATAVKLVPEVERMLQRLRRELGSQRQ